VDAALGELARLRAFELSQIDNQLTLGLAWEATGTTETAYRVFVHLLDDAGNIVAQSDSEPAAGSYPTTAWLPGDIIVDQHTIVLPADLPSGDYALVTGLYDPRTGERLLQSNATSTIELLIWQQ
jgi:hypothetical protein